MSDEQAKGTLNKAQGRVVEGYGKLTGNRREQVRGKAKQVQGDAQLRLGSLKDTVRRP